MNVIVHAFLTRRLGREVCCVVDSGVAYGIITVAFLGDWICIRYISGMGHITHDDMTAWLEFCACGGDGCACCW